MLNLAGNNNGNNERNIKINIIIIIIDEIVIYIISSNITLSLRQLIHITQKTEHIIQHIIETPVPVLILIPVPVLPLLHHPNHNREVIHFSP